MPRSSISTSTGRAGTTSVTKQAPRGLTRNSVVSHKRKKLKGPSVGRNTESASEKGGCGKSATSGRAATDETTTTTNTQASASPSAVENSEAFASRTMASPLKNNTGLDEAGHSSSGSSPLGGSSGLTLSAAESARMGTTSEYVNGEDGRVSIPNHKRIGDVASTEESLPYLSACTFVEAAKFRSADGGVVEVLRGMSNLQKKEEEERIAGDAVARNNEKKDGTMNEPKQAGKSVRVVEHAAATNSFVSAVMATASTSAAVAEAATAQTGVGVVVRVRPLSILERADPAVRNSIQCLKDIVVIAPTGGASCAGSSSEGRRKGSAAAAGIHEGAGRGSGGGSGSGGGGGGALMRPRQFHADHVFHSHSTQIDVYEQSCKHIVEGVFHGINGSILAYGATGSGKTHTMFGGSMSAAGIVYQAVQDIFDEKARLEQEHERRVRIKCSFVEIYNEGVFDLLVTPQGNIVSTTTNAHTSRALKHDSSSSGGKDSTRYVNGRLPLQVRDVGAEEQTREVNPESLHINGLTYAYPETIDDFSSAIELGHTHRFVAATGANAQSSRSHAIITVEVQVSAGKESGRDAAPATVARIRFCDLAGSERAASTSNTGVRLREGANINRSLLALGSVVQRLVKQKRCSSKQVYVPYRDSKLTRLLRDGIGGNCRTQMLFCLSPSSRQIDESLNTMLFAMQAKEIQVAARRNTYGVNSKQVAKNQELEIEELRGELAAARAELARFGGSYSLARGEGSMGNLSRIPSFTIGGGTSVFQDLRRSPPCVAFPSSEMVECATSATLSSPPVTSAGKQAATTSQQARQLTLTSPTSALPSNATSPEPQQEEDAIVSNGTHSRSLLQINVPQTTPLGHIANVFSFEQQQHLSPGLTWQHSPGMPRTLRQSVFNEGAQPLTVLENRLKEFTDEKKMLQHRMRDALGRQRDCDVRVRELKWKLARSLVSNAMGSGRVQGNFTSSGNPATPIGVAGLRSIISQVEKEARTEGEDVEELQVQLDCLDRSIEDTRQELLRGKQNTLLELLLDNANLRQNCTEAECLAANYHQEWTGVQSRQGEYEQALEMCVSAICGLMPLVPHPCAAARDNARMALVYAHLPTSDTKNMILAVENSLREDVGAAIPGQLLSGSESGGSTENSATTPPLPLAPRLFSHSSNNITTRNSELEAHFRDLLDTATSLRAASEAAAAAAAASGDSGSLPRGRRGGSHHGTAYHSPSKSSSLRHRSPSESEREEEDSSGLSPCFRTPQEGSVMTTEDEYEDIKATQRQHQQQLKEWDKSPAEKHSSMDEEKSSFTAYSPCSSATTCKPTPHKTSAISQSRVTFLLDDDHEAMRQARSTSSGRGSRGEEDCLYSSSSSSSSGISTTSGRSGGSPNKRGPMDINDITAVALSNNNDYRKNFVRSYSTSSLTPKEKPITKSKNHAKASMKKPEGMKSPHFATGVPVPRSNGTRTVAKRRRAVDKTKAKTSPQAAADGRHSSEEEEKEENEEQRSGRGGSHGSGVSPKKDAAAAKSPSKIALSSSTTAASTPVGGRARKTRRTQEAPKQHSPRPQLLLVRANNASLLRAAVHPLGNTSAPGQEGTGGRGGGGGHLAQTLPALSNNNNNNNSSNGSSKSIDTSQAGSLAATIAKPVTKGMPAQVRRRHSVGGTLSVARKPLATRDKIASQVRSRTPPVMSSNQFDLPAIRVVVAEAVPATSHEASQSLGASAIEPNAAVASATSSLRLTPPVSAMATPTSTMASSSRHTFDLGGREVIVKRRNSIGATGGGGSNSCSISDRGGGSSVSISDNRNPSFTASASTLPSSTVTSVSGVLKLQSPSKASQPASEQVKYVVPIMEPLASGRLMPDLDGSSEGGTSSGAARIAASAAAVVCGTLVSQPEHGTASLDVESLTCPHRSDCSSLVAPITIDHCGNDYRKQRPPPLSEMSAVTIAGGDESCRDDDFDRVSGSSDSDGVIVSPFSSRAYTPASFD